ncbi:MAG: L,D-transpeptidase [Symploca sp. SIO2B6]|nr:L,D-transpeptidase [Symploca sp. SIO2B6]
MNEDPCINQYFQLGTKDREIHLNLSLKAVRIYFRKTNNYEEFSELITGNVTYEMAGKAGWCHMHPVTVKLAGPTDKGLINFVVFCPMREIGFHSDHYKKNGEKTLIPGNESAGCIRIPDRESGRFFDLVQNGDCVRIYKRPFWRSPTFAGCIQSEHCSL